MAIGFAVLDFETTGLDAAEDSVVEVAVIQMSPSGRVQRRWESVIRPSKERWSKTAENIHFVRRSHIGDAPSFGEVANKLADLLEDRILVAHNIQFDRKFLIAEFKRIEAPIQGKLPTYCTLKWARGALDSPKNDLSTCCRIMRIPFSNAHRAMADCQAAACVWELALEGYKRHRPPISPRDVKLRPGLQMPRVHLPQRRGMTREDLNMPPPTKAELQARSDPSSGRPSGTQSFPRRLGGPVTKRKLQTHLRHVMHVGFFAQLVNLVARKPPPEFVLNPGDRVTLFGDIIYSRSSWEALLRCLTLDPGRMSKMTRVLVNNDPNSDASSVTRAKEQGIPIVTEKAFMDLLRYSIEAGSIPSTLDFSLAADKITLSKASTQSQHAKPARKATTQGHHARPPRKATTQSPRLAPGCVLCFHAKPPRQTHPPPPAARRLC